MSVWVVIVCIRWIHRSFAEFIAHLQWYFENVDRCEGRSRNGGVGRLTGKRGAGAGLLSSRSGSHVNSTPLIFFEPPRHFRPLALRAAIRKGRVV